MEEQLTRRDLLMRGAVLVGAAALPAACGGGSSGGSTPNASLTGSAIVYRLNPIDPKCGRSAQAARRCGCRACYSHARHKLFPTAAAANSNRAHRGCNCRIVRVRVARAHYAALFGEQSNLTSHAVDTRTKSVANILRGTALLR